MPAKSELLPLAALTSSYLAEQATKANEPPWLVALRATAWDFFAQTLPPFWQRTDLSKLHPETICPPAKAQGTLIQSSEALAALEAKGVVFTTLAAALQTHSDLIQEKLGKAANPLKNKFSALRMALWQDGIFLYVPKNVEINLPLHVNYTLKESDQAIFPYSLLILEPNARATFVEDFSSSASEDLALAGPTTEIFMGAGSELRFASIQQWGPKIYHLGAQAIVLERDARFELTSVALGGTVQHLEAEIALQGAGSQVNWLGATFASADQQLLTESLLQHKGINTSSFISFKTVVTEQSYSVFDGTIKIEQDSKNTISRLEEKAIHLSPDSRSDSIPGLRIDTNNLERAGHASTCGYIDEEQLFYLQSRGLSKNEAIHMIIMGFFEPVLQAIPLEELRATVANTIESKIL